MMRRRNPTRRELVVRKHHLEGEMNGLRSELRRLAQRGLDTSDVERKLSRARQRHFETRLEIDRTNAGDS